MCCSPGRAREASRSRTSSPPGSAKSCRARSHVPIMDSAVLAGSGDGGNLSAGQTPLHPGGPFETDPITSSPLDGPPLHISWCSLACGRGSDQPVLGLSWCTLAGVGSPRAQFWAQLPYSAARRHQPLQLHCLQLPSWSQVSCLFDLPHQVLFRTYPSLRPVSSQHNRSETSLCQLNLNTGIPMPGYY